MATSVMVSLNPAWSPPGGVGLDRGEAGGSWLSSSSDGAGVGVGVHQPDCGGPIGVGIGSAVATLIIWTRGPATPKAAH